MDLLTTHHWPVLTLFVIVVITDLAYTDFAFFGFFFGGFGFPLAFSLSLPVVPLFRCRVLLNSAIESSTAIFDALEAIFSVLLNFFKFDDE